MAAGRIGDADWTEDPRKAAKYVLDLERQATNRNNRAKLFLRLYWQLPYFSTSYSRDTPQYQLAAFEELLENASFGLTREVVDAAASRLNQPVQARVEPMGADDRIQVACKKLGYLVDGVVEATELHEIADQAYIDACTAGIGGVKWWVDKGKEIRCAKVDPLLTFWPEGTNDPDEIAVSCAVDRRRLMAEVEGKQADQIKNLPAWHPPTVLGVDVGANLRPDTVRVDEVWSKKLGNTKGKYARMAGGPNGILVKEDDWDYERLPVNLVRWQREFRGFGGLPLARVIYPYHVKTQELVAQWCRILEGCVPRFLEHEETTQDEYAPQAFQKVKWSGQVEPKLVGGNHVPDDILEAIEAWRQRAFAEGGVNPQAATGSKSAGVNSAVGQRTEQAIADVRFSTQQRGREKFFTDCARSIIMLAADTYTDSNPARIRAPGTKLLQSIPWSVIDLKEDQYSVFMGVTSGLSLTMAGRREELVELRDSGVPLSSGRFLKHMDLADTRALADRLTAAEDLADTQISAALDGVMNEQTGKLEPTLIPPSSIQDIETLITNGTQAYERAKADGVKPPQNLETLRRLLKLAAAKRPPAPPAPAAGPPGPGAAPPPAMGGPAPM